MVKASVFSILILCLALGTAAADSSFLDVIDSENLPPAAALRDETQWYRENRARIGRLGLDEAALPQEAELKNRLTRFLDLLTSQITRNQPNADLLLLRVLVYFDFYAVNWYDFRREIIDGLQEIEARFPLDYRAYWFLGSFYAQSFLPLDSIKQYSYVLENLNPNTPPSAFWRGYASAAGLADMPKHTLEACRICALTDPEYVPEDDIVFKVANHFQTPAFDAEIPPGRLYQFQVREEGFGILCRLFGVYVPVDKNWGTNPSGVDGNVSSLVFTPDPVQGDAGKEIPFTITMEFRANNRITFDAFAEEQLKKFPTAARSAEVFGDYPFLVYEVHDPAARRSEGGFHGYRLFLNRPEPAVKGLAVERPVAEIFDPKTGEPYYRPQRSFDRYNGDIYYLLTLDCGEEGFSQAAAVFKKFVAGLLFD